MPRMEKEYKDRLFCYIFGSEAHKEWTLSLYNAVGGTSYDAPEDITIATIEQVLYMGVHNDVAFLICDEVHLYEQQSTFNPNMPLRLMQYVSNIYERLITLRKKNKYGSTLISLPTPKLVVFYNGKDDQPEETTMYLSDAFNDNTKADADIWVRVRMININRGRSEEIKAACRPLSEYTWIVEAIRRNRQQMSLDEAVDMALNNMPSDFIIKPWLEANRKGVRNMLLTEYSEEETMQLFKEEYRKEGRDEGRKEGRKELSSLIKELIARGRSADIERVVTDPGYCDKLIEDMGLNDNNHHYEKQPDVV